MKLPTAQHDWGFYKQIITTCRLILKWQQLVNHQLHRPICLNDHLSCTDPKTPSDEWALLAPWPVTPTGKVSFTNRGRKVDTSGSTRASLPDVPQLSASGDEECFGVRLLVVKWQHLCNKMTSTNFLTGSLIICITPGTNQCIINVTHTNNN